MITNNAVIIGILLVLLSLIFHTSSIKNQFWIRFYKVFPVLLVCYFVPSLLNSFGIVDGDNPELYFVASRYLLPASLVLFTLSIDLKVFLKLGRKANIMMLTATSGIIIGGPVAVWIVSQFAPEVVGGTGPDAVWRGLATLAGDWIGGGANQVAMKEVFNVSDDLFSAMITTSVLIYGFWMAFLLYGAGISEKIDTYLKADTSDLDLVKEKLEKYQFEILRIPSFNDLFRIIAVAFGVVAIAHFVADNFAPFLKNNFPILQKFSVTSGFFWIVVISTTGGLLLSFTKFRDLEGAGASKIGSVFLYILVAVIGLKMNILAIFDALGLLVVGVIWILIHIVILFVVGKLIKSPFFFIAVGSQANIGGAASAPIVAAAFHPSLAPVGVLLAVLGYAVGTYGAWLCGILMQAVAP
jgi:uncharacterized membrane protein